MSILKLITYPNKKLRKITKTVTNFNTYKLNYYINNMFKTMDYYNGVGLAANQVNIKKSIIVININNNKIYLINPIIIKQNNLIKTKESCLSIKNKTYDKLRYNEIYIKTFNIYGKFLKLKFKNLYAVCIQHEIDHLNGKLILDT